MKIQYQKVGDEKWQMNDFSGFPSKEEVLTNPLLKGYLFYTTPPGKLVAALKTENSLEDLFFYATGKPFSSALMTSFRQQIKFYARSLGGFVSENQDTIHIQI